MEKQSGFVYFNTCSVTENSILKSAGKTTAKSAPQKWRCNWAA